MEDIEVNNAKKDFGGSLPVENVQELASTDLQNIPHRYIRPEINPDEVSTDESSQIPIIDVAKLTCECLGYELEMAKLHQACEEWGFFQVINHGAHSVLEKMKVVTDEFFKLPLEQKMAYAQLPNSIEGYGQAFVVSEDQKLDWGDMLFLISLPLTNRNLRFWPNIPTSFRSTLDEYSSELHKICIGLIKAMGTNLGLEVEKLSSMYQDGTQGIRMNYYPPCGQADQVYGLAPHSDATGLTLLVQVNEVEGLQIRKNGKWLPIRPFPGAIIVNIGDILEITSNGKYRSIEHRAVVNFQRERLSMAAFHGPNMTAKIGPLQEFAKENGAKYRTLDNEDYIKLVIKSKLDGKSLLDQLRISH
ncbi:OLC1v1031422C1 [Oldenlandia corymbosa var. corymbosa]|uniref:OLC1v1031422C1 n=1 Tax=Oldenlandia corymbosa var. corymbosa TaxID=529605 RepID=A0AAV1CJ68_OLDCO|nr:OLC1v1031422C1 [Oldenlandia corymbosa var. corymbosa]